MKVRWCVMALGAAMVWPVAAAAQDASAANAERGPDDAIIVEGERPLSRAEITKAVASLTRRIGLFDPVSRFTVPVCVDVMGLGDKIDRKIAERIRSNVAAVGLAIGDSKCTPNAIMIISDQPQAIYAEIQQSRPALVGVGISPFRAGFDDLREYSKTQLEALVAAGAPAVSWSTYRPNNQFPVGIQALATGGAFWGWNSSPSFARAGRSRGSAVLLLDKRKIAGVRLNQLADFATVHLLGSPRMDRESDAGNVPTILTLFDQDPRKAPQRLTTFDRAYLCGIYRLREGSLGTRMVQNMIDVYDSECVRVGAPTK